MPKVSIVLASYNGEKYISAQVKSLLGQDYHDFEIVATDDSSTDATPAILGDFAARFPGRVKLLLGRENLGCSSNFERGIRAASGEYIALCDQDDVWLPSKLTEMMGMFRSDASLVFCDLAIVDAGLKPLGYGMWRSLGLTRGERRALDGERAYEVLLRRSVVSGCGMIIRRDLALAALPFPAREYNVHDQWLARLASFQGAIVPCPRQLVLYRQHGGQQAGGTRLGLADVSARGGDRTEGDVLRRRWEILVEKLEALGIQRGKLDYARDWARAHVELELERAAGLSMLAILRFLSRGHYGSHFSGLRSLAKDLLFLAKRSAA